MSNTIESLETVLNGLNRLQRYAAQDYSGESVKGLEWAIGAAEREVKHERVHAKIVSILNETHDPKERARRIQSARREYK